jgi:hypothetical protein
MLLFAISALVLSLMVMGIAAALVILGSGRGHRKAVSLAARGVLRRPQSPPPSPFFAKDATLPTAAELRAHYHCDGSGAESCLARARRSVTDEKLKTANVARLKSLDRLDRELLQMTNTKTHRRSLAPALRQKRKFKHNFGGGAAVVRAQAAKLK